jgi:DNA-binding CsgD family transcriptional regulator
MTIRTKPGGKAPCARLDQPGLILVNSSNEPVYANDEAVRIISYPVGLGNGGSLSAVWAKLRSLVSAQTRSRKAAALREITSGRRHYLYQSFHLKSRNSAHAMVAVVIERSPGGFVDISEFMDQYDLTQREREVVQLLMRGMTSKEIASRMNISANTVKAFLRLVMIKTGVSTRTGIIGKLFQNKGRQPVIDFLSRVKTRTSPFGE